MRTLTTGAAVYRLVQMLESWSGSGTLVQVSLSFQLLPMRTLALKAYRVGVVRVRCATPDATYNTCAPYMSQQPLLWSPHAVLVRFPTNPALRARLLTIAVSSDLH